ncbi:hypothetical protein H5410_001688 [Solanum commersonii]|uniref:Uncharacterized protein n=1 Tax=Solanum commersonii TaxID=4109 RepID=A0A9J6B0B4_SOLCO|nr:hypothetical protein H5410_001688 [Solanum commersonii]
MADMREWVIHRPNSLTHGETNSTKILAECGTGSFHGNTYIHNGEPRYSLAPMYATQFTTPYSCENGLHCLNHPPFPSFVCSGPKNARSLVIGDPNLTCSWFINVGVVFTYLSVYERNCTKRKFSAQIGFPEMMKGKKEAPSPSPPFCPRLLNQSRLTFPPLCLGERESRLWSTQRLKRQIIFEMLRGLVIDGSSDLSGDDSAKRRM